MSHRLKYSYSKHLKRFNASGWVFNRDALFYLHALQLVFTCVCRACKSSRAWTTGRSARISSERGTRSVVVIPLESFLALLTLSRPTRPWSTGSGWTYRYLKQLFSKKKSVRVLQNPHCTNAVTSFNTKWADERGKCLPDLGFLWTSFTSIFF